MTQSAKIAIIVRCYSRVEDAVINVSQLLKQFSAYDYHIMVISNGGSDGFAYPKGQGEHELVRIKRDASHHAQGDVQLFREGLLRARELGIRFAICLTSDTWLLDESLLRGYMPLLLSGKRQWLSSQWNTPAEAGLDFALVNVDFVIRHELFWPAGQPPETWVYKRLRALGPQVYGRIREIFPVEYPRHLWRGGFDPSGDFHNDLRVMYFPRAKLVTHHVELLPGGMNSKKRYANECAGRQVFPGFDLDASQKRQYSSRERFRKIYHKIDDALFPLYARFY